MKKISKKGKKAGSSDLRFTLEIDVKGLIMFTGLAVLTVATVFYLGIITGKATRDPNSLIGDPAGLAEADAQQQKAAPLKGLEIYDVRDQEKKKEDNEFSNFKKDLLRQSQEAERLVNSSQKSVTKAAVPPVVQARTPVAPPRKQVKTPEPIQWPDVAPNAPKKGRVYTIQVMATRNETKARTIVEQLKQRNFDAYIVDVNIQGTKIYRVRVGKKSKGEINQMKGRLASAVKGLGKLQVIKL